MGLNGQPKIYPNLNPAAALPVDRSEIFTLRNFAEHYRMSRGREHGHYVPNSRFIFVTTLDGSTLLHPRYRHPAIAQGKPVLYAGEASFNNGRLEWWSNGSGNYRPDADHAAQAGLPMEQFYPYDQILKGLYNQPKTEHPKPASVQAYRPFPALPRPVLPHLNERGQSWALHSPRPSPALPQPTHRSMK